MADNGHDERLAFVEKVGLAIEDCGHPRIFGRITGWLLICDPPYQSFDDLVEVLDASKGSISNMTRLLIQVGLVEKFSLPGDRKTYFRISPGAWERHFRGQIEYVRQLCKIADEGLALLQDAPEEHRDRLREMNAFFDFIARKGPQLVEEYREEYKTTSAPA